MAHLPSTAVSLHAARQSRPVVAAAATLVHPGTGLSAERDETVDDSSSLIAEDGPLPVPLSPRHQVVWKIGVGRHQMSSMATLITIALRDPC